MFHNITHFDHCYGCGVCASACPQHAIDIGLSKEGFYHPTIKEHICSNCGICLAVCAYNHKEVCQQHDCSPTAAAAWSNNIDIRLNCSSGGTVYEIQKLYLREGYKICGVEYDIALKKAFHRIVEENELELQQFIGSKYIQSYTVNAFSSFAKGSKYLVIGTPCQIDSLRHLIRLRKIEDDFILIDFFCHSVPTVNLWWGYLRYINSKTPIKVEFRNKKCGWQNSYNIHIVDNGIDKYSLQYKKDLFYKFFLNDRCPNECCISGCKYKQTNSAADLRVGDMWGREYYHNNEGVNTVISFTSKGAEILDKIQCSCTVKPCDLSTATDGQMKMNAKRLVSRKVTLFLLSYGLSLNLIHYVASMLEFPTKVSSYISRIQKHFKI